MYLLWDFKIYASYPPLSKKVSVDESSLTGESDPIAKDDAKIASSSEKSLDVSSMRNICFQVGQCGLELHPSWGH